MARETFPVEFSTRVLMLTLDRDVPAVAYWLDENAGRGSSSYMDFEDDLDRNWYFLADGYGTNKIYTIHFANRNTALQFKLTFGGI